MFRRLRWAGDVARIENGKDAFKVLISTLTGKRHLGRPRRILEDNIRMEEILKIKEIGINTRAWLDSAQGMVY